MKTQTTILDLVTSAKNQEKTQEKIQKLNIPQQQQQNLQSQHMQHTQTEHLSKSTITWAWNFSNERSKTK